MMIHLLRRASLLLLLLLAQCASGPPVNALWLTADELWDSPEGRTFFVKPDTMPKPAGPAVSCRVYYHEDRGTSVLVTLVKSQSLRVYCRAEEGAEGAESHEFKCDDGRPLLWLEEGKFIVPSHLNEPGGQVYVLPEEGGRYPVDHVKILHACVDADGKPAKRRSSLDPGGL